MGNGASCSNCGYSYSLGALTKGATACCLMRASSSCFSRLIRASSDAAIQLGFFSAAIFSTTDRSTDRPVRAALYSAHVSTAHCCEVASAAAPCCAVRPTEWAAVRANGVVHCTKAAESRPKKSASVCLAEVSGRLSALSGVRPAGPKPSPRRQAGGHSSTGCAPRRRRRHRRHLRAHPLDLHKRVRSLKA